MRKPTIRDLAKKCGLSPSGVSAALRNRPNVSEKTRQRVLKIAEQIGYQSDARLTQLMSYLRSGKAAVAPPNVALLYTIMGNENTIEMPWVRGYLVGAKRRAQQFGYNIDAICANDPKLDHKRLPAIFKARGIEGIIIFHPLDYFPWPIPLDWDSFAICAIEGDHSSNKLSRVVLRGFDSSRLVMKNLLEMGYKRPGFVLGSWLNQNSDYGWRGGFLDGQYLFEPHNRIVPFIEEDWENKVVNWIKQEKPDVIVCAQHHILDILTASKIRVPEDVGLVHLNIYPGLEDWAGIDNQHAAMGEAAFDLMVAQLNCWEMGFPKNPKTLCLQSKWQPGRTCPPRRIK